MNLPDAISAIQESPVGEWMRYTRRAMPITNPLSLTDDEVYAVTAYVLFLNGIVGEDAQMNAQSLPQVKMPNHDNFIADPRPDTGPKKPPATTAAKTATH